MRVAVYVRKNVDGGRRRVGRQGKGGRRGVFQCNFTILKPIASCKAATLLPMQSETDLSKTGQRRDRSFCARLCC